MTDAPTVSSSVMSLNKFYFSPQNEVWFSNRRARWRKQMTGQGMGVTALNALAMTSSTYPGGALPPTLQPPVTVPATLSSATTGNATMPLSGTHHYTNHQDHTNAAATAMANQGNGDGSTWSRTGHSNSQIPTGGGGENGGGGNASGGNMAEGNLQSTIQAQANIQNQMMSMFSSNNNASSIFSATANPSLLHTGGTGTPSCSNLLGSHESPAVDYSTANGLTSSTSTGHHPEGASWTSGLYSKGTDAWTTHPHAHHIPYDNYSTVMGGGEMIMSSQHFPMEMKSAAAFHYPSQYTAAAAAANFNQQLRHHKGAPHPLPLF
ncbi:hypothetical protein SK128_021337 [Halocaridina rubra]|uniref:Uncharacterized protein n=1 Tax=Halocaridina rubra TaxID=373956 RepID=A0AAN8XJT6_HALRR